MSLLPVSSSVSARLQAYATFGMAETFFGTVFASVQHLFTGLTTEAEILLIAAHGTDNPVPSEVLGRFDRAKRMAIVAACTALSRHLSEQRTNPPFDLKHWDHEADFGPVRSRLWARGTEFNHDDIVATARSLALESAQRRFPEMTPRQVGDIFRELETWAVDDDFGPFRTAMWSYTGQPDTEVNEMGRLAGRRAASQFIRGHCAWVPMVAA